MYASGTGGGGAEKVGPGATSAGAGGGPKPAGSGRGGSSQRPAPATSTDRSNAQGKPAFTLMRPSLFQGCARAPFAGRSRSGRDAGQPVYSSDGNLDEA